MTVPHGGAPSIIKPQQVLEGAGVKLRRSFPTRAVDHLDPFLLFDDFSSEDPADFRKGFPWHPHRGIETVTYVLAGKVDHRDSLGNSGSIGPGEVQWMTSGSGIMHEEMPDPAAGPLTGFQLWVNLPAREKMTSPRYRDLRAGMIPRVSPGSGVTIGVIAGQADGIRGPVTGLSIDPLYLDVELAPDASATHPLPGGEQAFAYLFHGEALFRVNRADAETSASRSALVNFQQADRVEVHASKLGARYLLIAGKPLREPVARYGPFVMNTRAEIEQALRDLRDGTFVRDQPRTDRETWYGSNLRES